MIPKCSSRKKNFFIMSKYVEFADFKCENSWILPIVLVWAALTPTLDWWLINN